MVPAALLCCPVESTTSVQRLAVFIASNFFCLQPNLLPQSSAQYKNMWSYTSTHLYVFVAWYLINYGTYFTFLRIC
jgi:hypothetical protein